MRSSVAPVGNLGLGKGITAVFFMLCTPMATVRTDIKARLRKCFRDAVERVEDSDKAACATMGVKQPHYSEEMAGERPFNLDNKTNLDPRVWGWFAVYLAADFGIPEELETAQRLEAINRRMAKMDGPVSHERIA
jgi:hypothetical protein